jgi:sensor histidine kinase regulating citrate/malate metabolism
MTRTDRTRSAATTVFTDVAIVVVFVVVVLATALVLDARQAVRSDAESLTRSTSATIALAPGVASALQAPPAQATARLEPMAEAVRKSTGVDFITIMTSRPPRTLSRRRSRALSDRPSARSHRSAPAVPSSAGSRSA